MRRSIPLLLETLLVLIVGCVFGLLANHLSPKGLSLTHNHFPGSASPHAPVVKTNSVGIPPGGQTNLQNAPTNDIVVRLQAKGIQVADSNLVQQLFNDPGYAQELNIFIDARNDRHYQEGHVPGAFQFDHYRPASYLAPVLTACQIAEKIVIYCNGGNCEDSEFASTMLRDAGVPAPKLFVYPGGFSEWVTNGLPIEVGSRKSGVLREAQK